MSMRYYVVTVQRDKQEVACRSNFVDTFDVGKVLGLRLDSLLSYFRLALTRSGGGFK